MGQEQKRHGTLRDYYRRVIRQKSDELNLDLADIT